jgi:8-oxo-dGTP pyrophosphatase MutT (NUDIX family)
MIIGVQNFIFDNHSFLEPRLLIAKRSNIKNIAPGKWNVIGGKKEDNEDLYAASVREIKEEVDLDIFESDLFFLYEKKVSWEKENHFSSNSFYINLTKCFHNYSISLNPEHSEFKFVTLEQALEIGIVGFSDIEIKLIFKINEINNNNKTEIY